MVYNVSGLVNFCSREDCSNFSRFFHGHNVAAITVTGGRTYQKVATAPNLRFNDWTRSNLDFVQVGIRGSTVDNL